MGAWAEIRKWMRKLSPPKEKLPEYPPGHTGSGKQPKSIFRRLGSASNRGHYVAKLENGRTCKVYCNDTNRAVLGTKADMAEAPSHECILLYHSFIEYSGDEASSCSSVLEKSGRKGSYRDLPSHAWSAASVRPIVDC